MEPHEQPNSDDFAAFAGEVEPRLRRALVGLAGPDAASDAAAEGLAYAWQHWDRVRQMDNAAGYVYRVARSRIPRRRRRFVPADVARSSEYEYEPQLASLLAALPERQRVAAFLVHGCEWTHREVAELLGISPSTVANHCERAMAALRRGLGDGDGDGTIKSRSE